MFFDQDGDGKITVGETFDGLRERPIHAPVPRIRNQRRRKVTGALGITGPLISRISPKEA